MSIVMKMEENELYDVKLFSILKLAKRDGDGWK